jgi:16S rRNA (uracil1498-N3)-methyltransferase
VTPADHAVLRGAAAHIVVDDIDTVAVDEAELHHVFRVLRTRDGELVTVTDGAGRWRQCVARSGAIVPDGEVVTDLRQSTLTIACAIPKRDRPEWIVQKLAELGVGRIVVLHTARSVVRWDDGRAGRHLDKLRKVAREALQQSRGVWLPQVDGPLDATEVLPLAVAAEPGGRPIGPDDPVIAIGPEGGWTDDELALARDRVSLGDTILRVETAALAAAVRSLLR